MVDHIESTTQIEYYIFMSIKRSQDITVSTLRFTRGVMTVCFRHARTVEHLYERSIRFMKIGGRDSLSE